MCCCAKPNVNGEPGAYSWDGKTKTTYSPDPPPLQEGDVLLFDEPGRCGGLDSHSHHFRLLKGFTLLVRHGAGDARMRVSLPRGFSFAAMDSNTRYWLMAAIYHAYSAGKRVGADSTAEYYRRAFVEDRLKKRKLPKQGSVHVWIEPAPLRTWACSVCGGTVQADPDCLLGGERRRAGIGATKPPAICPHCDAGDPTAIERPDWKLTQEEK